jgi:methane monooxygenase PmoA-like
LQLGFQSEFKAVRGDVELKGDPEHAGVQYRPHNDVATGGPEGKAKYLFHADGIDPHKDKDLPWVALSYGLGGQRYTVQHMNHPGNPKGTVYSAYRDYGRFGAFPVAAIAKGQTLTLRYRFWIARGDIPARETLAARHAQFAKPATVEVLP